MSNGFDEIVKGKSDEELIEMANTLSDFTKEAQSAILQEVESRGGLDCLCKSLEEERETESEGATGDNDTSAVTSVEDLDAEQMYHASDSSELSWGSRTLKEELILNEWRQMVERGAGHGQFIIDGIQKRLEEANIPGGCTWGIQELVTSGIFSKVRRDFLSVRLNQFYDYHMYIGIRDYGIHLDCCRFLTVEPGILKQWFSKKLTGFVDALSMPKNILVHQDLTAWVTVVHRIVLDSVSELTVKLGNNPALLNKGSKGLLEIW